MTIVCSHFTFDFLRILCSLLCEPERVLLYNWKMKPRGIFNLSFLQHRFWKKSTKMKHMERVKSLRYLHAHPWNCLLPGMWVTLGIQAIFHSAENSTIKCECFIQMFLFLFFKNGIKWWKAFKKKEGGLLLSCQF